LTRPASTHPSPPAPQGPTLATQLRHTAGCVLAVEQGRSLSEVLPELPPALRPGVQALTFHALRHLGTARALVGQLVERKPSPSVQALLCSAVALLLDAADEQAPRYPAHTVVNQAVEAARQDRRTERQASFVNACLRRFLREREALLAEVYTDPVARWNHPLWWIERLQRDHPEDWQAILTPVRWRCA
jgi:16S rRNA (cytosine967-C5)-methyltransferase